MRVKLRNFIKLATTNVRGSGQLRTHFMSRCSKHIREKAIRTLKVTYCSSAFCFPACAQLLISPRSEQQARQSG